MSSRYFIKSDLLWVLVSAIGLLLFLTRSMPFAVQIFSSLICCFLVFFNAYKENPRLFFLLRLLLFFIVSAYAFFIKLYDRNMYFSVFEFTTQSRMVTQLMFGLTLFGAPFCWWGMRHASILASKPALTFKPRGEINAGSAIFFIMTGALMVLLSAYIILSFSKGTIFKGAYGGGIENVKIPMGAINVISGIGMAIVLYGISLLKKKRYYLILFALAGYFMVTCQLFRGLRQDMASTIMTLILIYLVVVKQDYKFKFSYLKLIVPLLVMLEIVGLLRSGISQWLKGEIGISQVLQIGLGNGAYSDVVYSGTLGPIATTFANTIEGIFNNGISPVWGKGYSDYIIRLLPEFLYPGRPEDYAFFFRSQFVSGGGIFEIAEAVINFSFWGAAIVPYFISFVLGYIYTKMETTKNLFWLIVFSSFSCVFIRGAWYQTFAYVKAIEIGLFLALSYFILTYVFNLVFGTKKAV